MKINLSLLVLAAAILGSPASAHAPTAAMSKPAALSSDMDRLKTLAGTWTGTASDGRTQSPTTFTYKVSAGGYALVETIDPGTAHEMVTVYHDRKGKASLTHYCAMGNQPRMQVKSSDGSSIRFELSRDVDFNPLKETHMHALVLTWQDHDHITSQWTSYEKGKAAGDMTMTLTRASEPKP